MSLIDTLNWRYACKKFDPSQKLIPAHVDFIKESIRLSPSSYGMQPFKVLVIEDQAIRERLRPVSWGQSQITDCSHLFVFCHYTHITREMVDAYARLRADTQGKTMEETMKYIDYMWGRVGKYSPETLAAWASKQCYIALSNLLTACGELRIDACPIEGFEKEEYNRILELDKKGLGASVVAAVGYRAEDEYNQYNRKVRKPAEWIFEEI